MFYITSMCMYMYVYIYIYTSTYQLSASLLLWHKHTHRYIHCITYHVISMYIWIYIYILYYTCINYLSYCRYKTSNNQSVNLRQVAEGASFPTKGTASCRRAGASEGQEGEPWSPMVTGWDGGWWRLDKVQGLIRRKTIGKWWLKMGFDGDLAAGYVEIAIQHDHRNSGFSHSWWFSTAMLNYQRVYEP